MWISLLLIEIWRQIIQQMFSNQTNGVSKFLYVIPSSHSNTKKKKELYSQTATCEKFVSCFEAKAQRQEI